MNGDSVGASVGSGPPMVSPRGYYFRIIVKISRSGGEVPASHSRMSTLSRQWQDWYLSHISLAWKSPLCALSRSRFPLMIKSCPVVTLWSNHGQWVLGCGFGCAVTHTQVKSSYLFTWMFLLPFVSFALDLTIVWKRRRLHHYGASLSKVEKGEDEQSGALLMAKYYIIIRDNYCIKIRDNYYSTWLIYWLIVV